MIPKAHRIGSQGTPEICPSISNRIHRKGSSKFNPLFYNQSSAAATTTEQTAPLTARYFSLPPILIYKSNSIGLKQLVKYSHYEFYFDVSAQKPFIASFVCLFFVSISCCDPNSLIWCLH
jgi:hypothetical protein